VVVQDKMLARVYDLREDVALFLEPGKTGFLAGIQIKRFSTALATPR